MILLMKMIFGTTSKPLLSLMVIKMSHIFHIRHIAVILIAAVLLTIFQFSFLPSRAFAGRKLTINSDMQFKFAEECFLKNDYSSAISEYNRFIYFFPGDTRVATALFRIGMSYFKSKNYRKAIEKFSVIIDRYNNDLSVQAYFMISESYIKLRQPGQALITLENLIHLADNTETRDEAYFRAGWINIQTASWEKAKNYFEKISKINRKKYGIDEIVAEIDASSQTGRKNPSVAGFLSIIPGGGFLYCERYRDAAAAFLLNGALIFAAAESFNKDLDVLGGLITLVELGFYSGNIYGSISSAHKHNRSKNNQLIDKLKKNSTIKLSAVKNKGLVLSFRYDF